MNSNKQMQIFEKYIREKSSLFVKKLFRYQSGVFIFFLLVVLSFGLWMWVEFYYFLETKEAPIERRIQEMESISFDESAHQEAVKQIERRKKAFSSPEIDFEKVFTPLPESIYEEE